MGNAQLLSSAQLPWCSLILFFLDEAEMFIAVVMLIIAPPGIVGISIFLFPILTSASHGIISALRDRRLYHGLGITGEGGKRQTNEKRPDAIQRGKFLGRR
jgi:hypothetical protein